MVSRRWPAGVIRCPTCNGSHVRFDRKRRIWTATRKHPKRQFSVKVGTIFEDSPLGLDKWLPAIWMLANVKNGVSSHEIARVPRCHAENRVVHAPPHPPGNARETARYACTAKSKWTRPTSAAKLATCTTQERKRGSASEAVTFGGKVAGHGPPGAHHRDGVVAVWTTRRLDRA